MQNLFPGEDVFQVRGQNGLLLNSMTSLPVVAGQKQIQSTADQALETFYPIAPTIDLQNTHVYQEKNDTGQPLTSFTSTHSKFLKNNNLVIYYSGQSVCVSYIKVTFSMFNLKSFSHYGKNKY